MATVVLPNRPADIDTGGSGAAGVWAGQRGSTAARVGCATTTKHQRFWGYDILEKNLLALMYDIVNYVTI